MPKELYPPVSSGRGGGRIDEEQQIAIWRAMILHKNNLTKGIHQRSISRYRNYLSDRCTNPECASDAQNPLITCTHVGVWVVRLYATDIEKWTVQGPVTLDLSDSWDSDGGMERYEAEYADIGSAILRYLATVELLHSPAALAALRDAAIIDRALRDYVSAEEERGIDELIAGMS